MGKRRGVWTGDDEAKWLGWLDSVAAELEKTGAYKAFAEDAKNFEVVVLLGMGGSSLCPEVLAETFGKENFYILDSTVPAQIKSLENKLDLAKTLFIVASKSGSTLEPNTFFQYFYDQVSEKVGTENAGRQFAAITDPIPNSRISKQQNNSAKSFSAIRQSGDDIRYCRRWNGGGRGDGFECRANLKQLAGNGCGV